MEFRKTGTQWSCTLGPTEYIGPFSRVFLKLCLISSYHWSYFVYKYNYLFAGSSWYCSAACRQAELRKRNTDHLTEYVRGMTWYGLLQMVHHDAQKENDGDFMALLWEICIILFWNSRHSKYLILAHRIAVGM